MTRKNPLDEALQKIEAAAATAPPRNPGQAATSAARPSHGESIAGTDDDREIGDAYSDDPAAAIGPSGATFARPPKLGDLEAALYDGQGNPDLDRDIVAACATLDHSDTDNGKRLLAHFGMDLKVMRIADAKSAAYVGWAGDHWDPENGALLSHATAQKVGDRIGLEADLLARTPIEEELILAGHRAEDALGPLRKLEKPTDVDRRVMRDLEAEIRAGEEANAALEKRQAARRRFAVSSKNTARIVAMLACAAPHCAVDPDDFNADPFVLATKGETLRFERLPPVLVDGQPAGPRMAKLVVTPGHDRADMITRVGAVGYDKAAKCPKWRAFLDEFLPSGEKRDFIQTFSGIGLLGRTVQMLVFHYGTGANGKSVFLETLMRVLGPLGVGLPAESVTGAGDRASGGASPDLARLYGARTVRILELPADKPLHEDLIKKLTGGEKIPVRTLFKGYFDFTPVFTAHMSGNGYPKIDGTDNGIWRRMKVVEWPIELPPERQRPFDDVLAEFEPEYPGILNWLIEGALTYLEQGLFVPKCVEEATDEYRSAMDPIRDFVAACVERELDDEGAPVAAENATWSVTAREMYRAYEAWGQANAHKPFSETRFGTVMRKKITRTDERVRRYVGCRLHDVPPVSARDGYEPPGERG